MEFNSPTKLGFSAEQAKINKILNIIYLDTELLNSVYSQINSGIIKQISTTTTENAKTGTDFSVDIKVVGGGTNKEQSTASSITNTKELYHYQLLSLLEAINLPIYEEVPEQIESRLISLNGGIQIIDTKRFKDIINIFNNRGILRTLDSNNRSQRKEYEQLMPIIGAFANLFNGAVNLTVCCGDENIKGILKEEYLALRCSDIYQLYGNKLPGLWNILGIIDTPIQCPAPQDQTSPESMLIALESVLNLGVQNTKAIIPIAIYRGIDLQR